jgi:hypothetical protein
LNEVTADKAGGQSKMAEQLAKQPRGIPAGTAPKLKRFLRALDAGSIRMRYRTSFHTS